MGANIQGPSLIRVPDWAPRRLGRYYLYFADHKGNYIRLAFADSLEGPWRIHTPGALQLKDSGLPTTSPAPPLAERPVMSLAERVAARLAPPGTPGVPDGELDASYPHLASPDVHVDHAERRFRMYFHGLTAYGVQRTRVAISPDGLNFTAGRDDLGPSYFRVFDYADWTYALAMPGVLYRSAPGMRSFEAGPRLFPRYQRHTAVLVQEDILHVFWTRVGDAPERIYVSQVRLSGDWRDWRAGEATELLRPECVWEGAELPVESSWRSAITRPVNQVRDPCVYSDGDRHVLLYAVQGERGIAIADLSLPGG
jgi:hypothetical protein